MSNHTVRPLLEPPSSWSNRILILATAGILFLTMYPFRFSFHLLPNGASPFFLGKSQKSGLSDAFLNVLLFVPFGFGLAEKLRERGKSARLALLIACATGAFFSYTIEFLQLYIPERDSGWEDVFTNGLGSLVGSALYLLAGGLVVRAFSSAQRFLAGWLTPIRIACVLLVYFCCWFALGGELQKQSRLSNWKPTAILTLGNDALGRNSWRGQIQTLQIWDHAVDAGANAAPKPAEPVSSLSEAPVIDYDFWTLPDGTSHLNVVPTLFWIPIAADSREGPGVVFDGQSWLSTKTNAGDLAERLRKTNQFSIHLVCSAEDLAGAYGRIVYISDSDGVLDLMIRQDNAGLAIWFRTPLASPHTQLIWSVPHVFNEHRQHDILYSYDGSNLSLTLDGQKQRPVYRLGPGTALARTIRAVKTAELAGNDYIFYTMVFFAAGILLGFSAPYRGSQFSPSLLSFSLLAFGAAAIALEFVLASVSGRILAPSHILLSLVLGISGFLWSFADGDLPLVSPLSRG